jgi:hypothetical protein
MTYDNVHGIEDGDGNVLPIGSITDGQFLKRDGNSIISAEASGGYTSKASVYLSSAQSIPKTTWTKVEFDTEVYDTDGEFDNVTNYRFTATETGWYSVVAVTEINLNIDTGKSQWNGVKKNGGGTMIMAMNQVSNGTICPRVQCSGDVYLEADDYIELWVYHNATDARNLTGAVDATYMMVHRFA